MKRVVSIFHFIDRFSLWSGKVVSYLLFPIIGLLFYEVVARYFFNRPTLWSHEMSMFLFGTLGMLVGPYCSALKVHIRMDLVYNHFSPRVKAAIDAIASVLFFYFIGVLLWEGGKFALNSISYFQHSSSVWGPPLYPIKTVIPVAAFLMLVQGVANFIRDIFFAIYGRPLT